MGPIGKIFGRKSETESGGSDGPSGLQKYPTGPLASQPDQPFGLKFALDSGESQTFTSLPITIGRSEENHLVLKDPTVSAKHATVYYDQQVREICIMDCDSLNGVFIDGHPTRKNVLQGGAKIRLGNVNLTFIDTGYIHPGAS